MVAWIEANLCHGPGDVQGEPVVLDDEQVAFVFAAYEIDDRGRRLRTRAVYSRPKGRAKSELAAFLCWAEALGPVRFGGWVDGDPDKGPVGIPVRAPFIKCCATEEGQAGNTYGAVEFIGRHGPIAETPGLDVGITRTLLPGGGEIRAVTASAASKDGGKETFVVFDETHLYVLPELHRMHATLRRNLAKRKIAEPWCVETTTMYAPGEGSVAESAHKLARAVQAGKVKDRGLLFDHEEGWDPDEFDFSDDDQLRAALMRAYGEASEWMDFERLVAEAREAEAEGKRDEWIRYFLNRPVEREDKWITTARWASLGSPDAAIPEGAQVVIALDVGIVQDSTAIVAAHAREDGRVAVRAHVIGVRGATCHELAASGRVSLRRVEDVVRDWCDLYDVGEVVYDPRFAEALAENLSEDGVTVVELPQNSAAMADAYQRFYAAVSEGTVCHDGDPVLADHINSTVASATNRGWQVRKVKNTKRIDACVAAVMAHYRAQAVHPSPFVEAW
ncbi:MAG TPA: terminase TerL endonuclease subunit [Miltoncostaeaceae bacterium]|nr:terminase TerL endonuclease subunit [Miltoncostaeaceae bacterium]